MRKYTHHYVQVRSKADLNRHQIITITQDNAMRVILHGEYQAEHIHESETVLRQPLSDCVIECQYDSQWLLTREAQHIHLITIFYPDIAYEESTQKLDTRHLQRVRERDH